MRRGSEIGRFRHGSFVYMSRACVCAGRLDALVQFRICEQGVVCSMQMFRTQEPQIMHVNVGFGAVCWVWTDWSIFVRQVFAVILSLTLN
jgi:hypothetical protein